MEIVELETNLSLYRAQLQHLEDFPADHTSAGDRAKEMEILREELKELISLTEDALLTSKKQELLAMLQTSDSNADCASTSVDTNTNQVQPSEADMEDDTEDDTLFNELVGTQCSAVFRTSNGAVRRLNAVVFDVDQYSQRCSLFCCTPTERRLVPCRFFLADRCAFDAHSCRYSHGYEASLDELTEYVEPDFALLRSGLRCLARRVPINPSSSSSSSSSDQAESGTDESADAELWQEAVVERVLLGTLACIVRFSGGTCETVPFVNIFPLVEYVVELSDTDSNDEQLEDDDAVIEVSSAGEPVRRKEFAIEISDDEDEVRFVGITNNDKYTAKSSSLTKSSTEMKAAAATPSSVGFGSWERYTSGIGSKLLRRMGYVEGRGLGAGGEGRVEPVPIQVLPSGRTLDEIMRLKAAANDHQLFNVSDTFGCDAADGARLDWALRRIRKLSYHRGKSGNSFPHAKAQRVRSSADNKNGGDVFAFINRRIQEHGPPLAKHGPVIAKQNVKLSVKQLSRRSDRELNVEGLQYERKLRELDTQIANQEATVSRIGSSGAHATQARDRLTKLRALRDETRVAMRRLENHQEARKQNAKFVKF